MNKKILQIIITGFLLVLNINSQTPEKDRQRYDRADVVIELSQKAIYQNVKRENVKSVHLKTGGISVIETSNHIGGESEPRLSKARQTTEEDISFEHTDKINNNVFIYHADKNPVLNYIKLESVLNGDKFSANTDIVTDGKLFDMREILDSTFVPESIKKQMKQQQEASKKAITKDTIQKSASSKLFPILLDKKLMNGVTFVYIGKAEIGDKKADILEIEADTGRQTRYFFDEKTHFLLMMTDEIAKDGKFSKTTIYFDDYQIFNGLMIAKKVNTEMESSFENLEMEIMGRKMKVSSRSKTISETIVKEFKINPAFKTGTFAVKESK